MKKNNLIFLILLFLYSIAIAKNNTDYYYDYTYPVEPISNVWKITKPGQQTSYIIGSVRIGEKNNKLSSNIKNIIKKSNVIVTEIALEISPNGIENSKYNEYLNSAKDTTSGEKLCDKIGNKLYNDIIKFIKKNHKQKIFDITYIQPWFLINLMSNYLVNDFDFFKSIDYLIVEDAVSQNKKFNYLENFMDLQKIFSKIPIKYIIPELKRYITYENIIRKEVKMSYNLYKKGNYKEMLDLQFEGYNSTYNSKEDEKFWMDFNMNTIIYYRNKIWTDKILNLLEKDSTVIVVGFLHLFTPKGLIKILQDNGYQVTAVK